MSYMLPHLHNGWQVDQAILSEEDRVVVIRFGHDWDPTCMKMDEVLYSIAEKVTQPRLTTRPAFRLVISSCWIALPEQAHHDRPGHWQQQQDQLGHGRQAGDDRHHRDGVPGGPEGPRPGRVPEGLLHQVQILSPRPVLVHAVPWGRSHAETFSTI
ncbi:thioredoxin-like protein 4A isoform X2 [Phocoena sinus]|uniref:thioredoxin-like protein 4A isoform X2 n=1 Tax=Phocoena sinus TaxID=42100 RepID=UPI0013C3FACC|nr:thioredoxin-like protein 4A isoform X2 [Phocoena sinus]